MHCPNCDQVSLGSCCHYCGACEGQAVGFSLSDLPNPYSAAYEFGRDLGSGESSVPTPYSAYQAGRSIGDQVSVPGDAVKGATGAVSSLLTTMKWVAIGGAALAGTVILFSVYQAWKHDLPGRSLEAFKASEREKTALAGKYLGRGS